MDKGSIARLAVLFVAFVNQGLVMAGYSPLPFEGQEVEMFVSTLFTIGASALAWYKHNFVGKKGKKQKETLEKEGLK